jgi:hypothetical protein
MTDEIYREAQNIKDEIATIENKIGVIKKYAKRDSDKEFNSCRETAYNVLDVLKKAWEKKFREL